MMMGQLAKVEIQAPSDNISVDINMLGPDSSKNNHK